jgi:hypothetical protein
MMDINLANKFGPVLLLANQPFQLKLMSSVAKQLMELKVQTCIVLTDLYSFVYEKSFIEEVEIFLGQKIESLEKEFKTWQLRGEPSLERLTDSRMYLNANRHLTSVGRNFDTLRRTDPNTNGFEFNAWYLKISNSWKDVAHADILRKSYDIVERLRPRLIVSIDHLQLMTNFMHAIVENDITFLTFQNSRIGPRWITRRDLAIGNHLKELQIVKSVASETISKEIQNFIDTTREGNRGIYAAPSIKLGNVHSEFFSYKASRRFEIFVRQSAIIMEHFVKSLLLGPLSRTIKVRRFDQSFLRINLVECKRKFYQFRRDSVLSPDNIIGRYFFWTLHYRPEGSGLVLGNGLDEFDFIELVSEKLQQHESLLVIKENPLMYGTRKRSELRRLKSLENVLFAPRYSQSFDWIRRATGVIGISGTSLLEAALLGIPSFAFGSPEFENCVWKPHEIPIANFIAECISKNMAVKSTELYEYLNFIFSNSSDSDVMLDSMSSETSLQPSIFRMVTIIHDELESKK